MLRATLSRYAQRLGGRVSALSAALAIACSASTYADSTMHVSGSAADAGLACASPASAGGAESCGTMTSLSVNGTLISTLASTARSNDAGDVFTRKVSLADVLHPFINCTGSGLTSQRYSSAWALDETIAAAARRADAGAARNNRNAGPFAFNPTAGDTAGMTAMDFRKGAAFDLDFMARFRGFDEGGSDKMGAMVVPLPPALPLGLAGLIGAIFAARRMSRRSAA
jgi:hypothetical protein